MLVLALYDIRGNVDALEAVLTEPDAQAVDAVVIGGDAVPGSFAAATLDRIAALDGRRILGAGWPDQCSIDASLIDPVDSLEITTFFETLVG